MTSQGPSGTTIFRARKIITMNPGQPEAECVAVRDGRILGAGRLSELEGWGDYQLDDRFADKILMPGLVEGHSHVMEGSFWAYVYCGYFDRLDPEGKLWAGLKSIDAVIERLRAAEAGLPDAATPLAGWALDAIYFGNQRVTRGDLDQVSTTRAVGVLNASAHILNVNSKALELAGLLRTGINHPGIPLGDDGLPSGELKGPDAMALAGIHVGFDRAALAGDETGLRQFARLCVRQGVTTATDLANLLPDDAVDMMLRVTGESDFPARIVALRRLHDMSVPDIIKRAKALAAMSTERCQLGIIKVVADGSIQGFSARLRWPGYYNGAPNGLWYVPREQLAETYLSALVRPHKNALWISRRYPNDKDPSRGAVARFPQDVA